MFDATCPGLLQGLYLVGSIALDDFRPDHSDVDFIAVTAEPILDSDLGRIEAVHRQFSQEPGPALEGFYLDRGQTRQPPDPGRPLPFELGGRFRVAPCFEASPVTWRIWQEHGIPVRGEAPATLDLQIDPVALHRFELANLKGYWTDWVAANRSRPGPVDPELLGWGVLGISRLAQVLATRTIGSKTEAGVWALEYFAPRWRPIIEDALAARRGQLPPVQLDRFQVALDFMAHVAAEAQRLYPLR